MTPTVAELERQLRDAFDQDLTANFIANIEGRILQANPAFRRVFGFDPPESATGYLLSGLYPSQEEFRQLWERVLSGLELKHHLTQMRARDGQIVHVVQNIVPATQDSSGSIASVRGYIFDRTAERELEEELARTRRLDTIGRLAGGIAHDFNNLLTVIISSTDLLADELPEQGAARELLDQITMAADRAAAMTSRLLSFGRQRSRRLALRDLGQIVEGALGFVRSAVGERHVVNTESGHRLPILADGEQIEQVVVNLVMNAKDAMPTGGEIAIRTDEVNLDSKFADRHVWARPGRYAQLSVIDSGTGMTQEILDCLYEPFFSTKPTGSGTGLGLASCYGIVKAHDGFIHCQSMPGAGTRFDVYLPLREHLDSELPESRHAPAVMGGDETILLVDDDAAVRSVTSQVLQRAGYRVARASSGESALKIIARHPSRFQLAIVDVVMSGFDGPATVCELRKVVPNLPALLCSGYAGDRIPPELLHEPLTRFLAKPFAPPDLLRLVRYLLDERISSAKS